MTPETLVPAEKARMMTTEITEKTMTLTMEVRRKRTMPTMRQRKMRKRRDGTEGCGESEMPQSRSQEATIRRHWRELVDKNNLTPPPRILLSENMEDRDLLRL